MVTPGRLLLPIAPLLVAILMRRRFGADMRARYAEVHAEKKHKGQGWLLEPDWKRRQKLLQSTTRRTMAAFSYAIMPAFAQIATLMLFVRTSGVGQRHPESSDPDENLRIQQSNNILLWTSMASHMFDLPVEIEQGTTGHMIVAMFAMVLSNAGAMVHGILDLAFRTDTRINSVENLANFIGSDDDVAMAPHIQRGRQLQGAVDALTVLRNLVNDEKARSSQFVTREKRLLFEWLAERVEKTLLADLKMAGDERDDLNLMHLPENWVPQEGKPRTRRRRQALFVTLRKFDPRFSMIASPGGCSFVLDDEEINDRRKFWVVNLKKALANPTSLIQTSQKEWQDKEREFVVDEILERFRHQNERRKVLKQQLGGKRKEVAKILLQTFAPGDVKLVRNDEAAGSADEKKQTGGDRSSVAACVASSKSSARIASRRATELYRQFLKDDDFQFIVRKIDESRTEKDWEDIGATMRRASVEASTDFADILDIVTPAVRDTLVQQLMSQFEHTPPVVNIFDDPEIEALEEEKYAEFRAIKDTRKYKTEPGHEQWQAIMDDVSKSLAENVAEMDKVLESVFRT